jgi:hypothetical protein
MCLLDGIATAAFAVAAIALVARYLPGVNRPVLATAALATFTLQRFIFAGDANISAEFAHWRTRSTDQMRLWIRRLRCRMTNP